MNNQLKKLEKRITPQVWGNGAVRVLALQVWDPEFQPTDAMQEIRHGGRTWYPKDGDKEVEDHWGN